MSIDFQDYRQITSSLEGRLLVYKGKHSNVARPSSDDFFVSRRERTYRAALRTAALKAFADTENITTTRADHPTLPPRLGVLLTNEAASHSDVPNILAPPNLTSIHLSEAALFLQSYDREHAEAHSAAVLRGCIKLKRRDIPADRKITLELNGKATTAWPEAWRLRNVSRHEEHRFLSRSAELDIPLLSSARDDEEQVVNFELLVNSMLPESIDLPLGRVHYELSGRIGKAKIAPRTVKVVRMNCMCAYESAEPWCVIGRQDWIRYFFVFPDQSWKVGGVASLHVRLSNLSEITWHYLEVRLIEDVVYSTRDSFATRVQSKDKGIMFRRTIGRAIRTMSQVEAEEAASALRRIPMSDVEILPPAIKSLTAEGSDMGLQNFPETVVMDEKVSFRLPPCCKVAADPAQAIHHATTYKPIEVQHFIKFTILVTRTIRPGRDMTYELVVKVPVHILSCQIRDADTVLPAYDSVRDRAENASACTCSATELRDDIPAMNPYNDDLDSLLGRQSLSHRSLPPSYGD